MAIKTNVANDEEAEQGSGAFCALRETREPEFGPPMAPDRSRLLRMTAQKWVNGTVLHYYFFDRDSDREEVSVNGERRAVPWRGASAQAEVVRKAFRAWQDVGIGVRFEEVSRREDAEIRIGFMRGDGSWSYIGRDCLDHGSDERTMNFGWSLTPPREIDTALHEIGHALGFPHEHQNPHAGIVWKEEAVYAALAQPPNGWDRATTHYNIIRKLSPSSARGSSWDRDSIMHYPFEAGLIEHPAEYRQQALTPKGGFSELDKHWARFFYPPQTDAPPLLEPLRSVPLEIVAGGQRNFRLTPRESRHYELQTFGESDVVMVLFEDDEGQARYLHGDDDSGTERNARLRVKLLAGRNYLLRVRLNYAPDPRAIALMMW